MSLAARLGYVPFGTPAPAPAQAAPAAPHAPVPTTGSITPHDDRVVSALATPSRFGLVLKGGRRKQPPFGIVVHTTGSGPARLAEDPSKAKSHGCTTAVDCALAIYARMDGFPHYVIDYDGTIYAVCPEDYVAWHAGWTSAMGGRDHWKHWTSPEWWSRVWGADKTPLDLIPAGANSPNSRHLGVELLGANPVAAFREAQYESLARLVVDCDRRHGLRIDRAPSAKLLGHEDVNPATGDGGRANASGGWDPGAHRVAGATTYFSWSRLWTIVERLRSSGESEIQEAVALFEPRWSEGESLQATSPPS